MCVQMLSSLKQSMSETSAEAALQELAVECMMLAEELQEQVATEQVKSASAQLGLVASHWLSL